MTHAKATCEYAVKPPTTIDGNRGGTFPAILCGAPATTIRRSDGLLVTRCTEHTDR